MTLTTWYPRKSVGPLASGVDGRRTCGGSASTSNLCRSPRAATASRPGPIGAIGTQGVFTKELQRALLDGTIDLAVHSLKDLPTEPVDGLGAGGGAGARADRRLSRVGPLSHVRRAAAGRDRRHRQPATTGATAACSARSARWKTSAATSTRGLRKAARRAVRGDHLGRGGPRASAARCEHRRRCCRRSIMLPAVGQGALGIESRADDAPTRELLKQARRRSDACGRRCRTERCCMRLRGGCLAPVGAWGRIEDDGKLHLERRRAAVRRHAAAVRASLGGDRSTRSNSARPRPSELLGTRSGSADRRLAQAAGPHCAAIVT